MEFKELEKDNYTKYIVKVTYVITKDQFQPLEDKTFDSIPEAIAYIKKIQKDFKKFSGLYKEVKVKIHRIKTSEVLFEVVGL